MAVAGFWVGAAPGRTARRLEPTNGGKGQGQGTHGLPGVSQRRASSGSSRSHRSNVADMTQGFDTASGFIADVDDCFNT
jgi:hypothetical protein